ncbi:WD40 repeat domain-containing serine/threonine-protein kinase, partial [Actinomadura fulvescens]
IKSLSPDLEGAPPGLRDIIERCLAKDPAERPPPAELVSEFAAAAALGPPARPEPGFAAAPPSPDFAAAPPPGPAFAAAAPPGPEFAATPPPGPPALPFPVSVPASAGRRPSRRAILAAGVAGVLATAATAAGAAKLLLGEIDTDEAPVAYGKPFTSDAIIAHHLVFSPDGRTIFTAKGLTDQILVFDVGTGRLMRTFRTGHKITIGGLTLTPDGTTLATAGVGQPGDHVALWDARTGQRLDTFRGAGGSPRFSPDGRVLAANLNSPTEDSEIQFWDMLSRSRIATIKGGGVHAFSPDGRLLAGVADRSVVLWDVTSRRPVVTVKETETDALAFSPDGRMIALGDYGKVIKLRDTTTGALLAELRLTPEISPGYDGIRSLAFSRDGRYLASDGAQKKLLVWDVATRRLATTLTGHTQDVNVAAFSPDGRTLASGGGDTVRLWDITKFPRP